MQKLPQIFLSYCHANKEFALQIYYDLQQFGIVPLFDERDAEYKASIKEFMQKIGKSDYAIMLISDEFLKSENCMYEVIELLNSHEIEKRILPVLLENAGHIFKDRTVYYSFWETVLEQCEEANNKYKNEDTILRVKHIRNIKNNIDSFFVQLTNLIVIPFNELKEKNYSNILAAIGLTDRLIEIEIETIFSSSPYNEDRISMLMDLYHKTPQNERILFHLSNSYHFNRNYVLSERYLKELFEIHPYYNAESCLNYGFLLFEKYNDYKNANIYLLKSLELDPQDFLVFNLLGKLRYETNEYLEAISFLEKSLELGQIEGDYEALYMLGDSYARTSDELNKAIDYFNRSIIANPNTIYPHLFLGDIYKDRLLDKDKAFFHFQTAKNIDPEEGYSYEGLGDIYLAIPAYDTAIYYYSQSLEKSPNNIKVLEKIAYTFHLLKDYDDAIFYYKKIVEFDKFPVDIYINLSISYIAQGDLINAKYYYTIAVEKQPDLKNLEIEGIIDQ